MTNHDTPLAYFRALSAIPRVSGQEAAAADYVESVARAAGCQVWRDAMDNLIVTKAASAGCENAPPFVLQGHLDMVGEAAPGVRHDFSRDPIELVEDGDTLRANGTTLGGDDGVAVALMLALLTDETAVHPPLECVFTVQEETGLYGAMALDTSRLRGRTLLNLDAGPEGIFVVTCAGGCRAALKRPIRREDTDWPMWSVEISGLAGGHSGSAIGNQGANALVLAGLLADRLRQEGARLAIIRGGEKDNVIPSAATVEVAWDRDPAGCLEPLLADIRANWQATDPNLTIACAPAGGREVLRQDDADALIDLLLTLPNGVVSYSTGMPGLVETSANLAVARTGAEQMELELSMRSASDLRKEQLIRRVERLADRFGAACTLSGKYPGWNYDPNSPLRETAVEAYRAVYGAEPRIEGIHAGLECGVFKGALPDLDILATGPNYGGMHTPDEWLDMPSLERTYRLILEILLRYAQNHQ